VPDGVASEFQCLLARVWHMRSGLSSPQSWHFGEDDCSTSRGGGYGEECPSQHSEHT
jgi:hypothetical protein